MATDRVTLADNERRSFMLFSPNWAEHTCPHSHTTVSIDTGESDQIGEDQIIPLTLYLAYLPLTCDCFRDDWRRLVSGSFEETAARMTYQRLAAPLGSKRVTVVWDSRCQP